MLHVQLRPYDRLQKPLRWLSHPRLVGPSDPEFEARPGGTEVGGQRIDRCGE